MPGGVRPPEGRWSAHHRLRGTRPRGCDFTSLGAGCTSWIMADAKQMLAGLRLCVVPRTGDTIIVSTAVLLALTSRTSPVRRRAEFIPLPCKMGTSTSIRQQQRRKLRPLCLSWCLISPPGARGGRQWPTPAAALHAHCGKVGFQYLPSFVGWKVRCPPATCTASHPAPQCKGPRILQETSAWRSLLRFGAGTFKAGSPLTAGRATEEKHCFAL